MRSTLILPARGALSRQLCAALLWSGLLLSLAAGAHAARPPDPTDAEGMYHLGISYAMGDPAQGVEADPARSRYWLERAAGWGSLPAVHALGWIYFQGHGVPRDHPQAFRYFADAAARGYAESQFLLGLMYAKGEGVVRDNAVSLQWIKLAADQGHPEANRLLESLFHGGAAPSREAP